MRWFYTLLLLIANPFVVAFLLWRGRKQPEYGQRLGERFGYVPAALGIHTWVHAVSVGEVMAALPLIEALIARHGAGRIWVTCTTPTGSARIVSALGARVRHSYAPYDLPHLVSRFLARVQPQRVIIMETELWPNLFAQLAQRGTPLLIANARISPRSFRGYSKWPRFCRSVLSCVTEVAAQSEADAQRFSTLGAPRVSVMGNIKFDFTPPQALIERGHVLRAQNLAGRPVWVAASTHEGEEEAALRAHAQLLRTHPNALLVLVPRHPQRFDDVARVIETQGLSLQRRSLWRDDAAPASPQVLLGDSMGEMFLYYALADVAFVGGSFAKIGGHNVLEPAALGLPVLFGPQMHNFLPARELLLSAGAAREVADEAALAAAVSELLNEASTRSTMGEAGRAAIAANRGALHKLLRLLGESNPSD